MILNVGGKHLQAVDLTGPLRRDRCGVAAPALGQLACGIGRRVGGLDRRMAELVGEVTPALGVGDRVRPHMSNVAQRHARVHQQVEADIHHHLTLDQQLRSIERQGVERGVDRPLDHVLDRCEPIGDLAALSGTKDLDDRPVRPKIERGQVGLAT